MMTLACLIDPHEVCAQNNLVEWSAFSSGFGVPSLPATVIKSSVGQTVAGRSQLANNVVESGFLVHPLFRGPLVSVPEEEPLPTVYALYQNYPNPFNPSTTIKYQLPVQTHVEIKLHDVLGREVAALVDEQQDAGYRKVEWNAAGFASGVYFCRLQTTDVVQTKKLVLLR
jgi:hypothetical protein